MSAPRRLHVAFLNQYALPAGSAGITRHGDIGAELVRRGHRATVVASDYDYFTRQASGRAYERASDADGVTFVWLQTGSYTGNDRGRVKSMVRYGWNAARATMQLDPRPDVVVGSSPHLLAPLAAAMAARRLGVPWIFEVRDFWPSALVDLGALRAGSPIHWSLEQLEELLYRNASGIVSVPPNGAERLRELRLKATKLVHIPNGTALTDATRGALPASLEAIFQELNGRFVIVYTGALGVAQNLDVVLEAMAQLRTSQPGQFGAMALLLIGDGVNAERLETTIRRLRLDNVRLHPAISKTDIVAVLDKADACLLQLGSAGFLKYGLSPNKLFDYFAAAKPVLIASNHPTIVDGANAGLRFEPGSPGAFANAAMQIMDTPAAERAAMGARGAQLVQARYSIPAIANVYEDVLQRVVRRRRG